MWLATGLAQTARAAWKSVWTGGEREPALEREKLRARGEADQSRGEKAAGESQAGGAEEEEGEEKFRSSRRNRVVGHDLCDWQQVSLKLLGQRANQFGRAAARESECCSERN